MADYYSHRDPRQKGDKYLDYDTGSGAGWIWAIVVLVAFVALIALGTSGGVVDGTATDGTAPAATDSLAPPADNTMAPPPAADTSTPEAPAATAPVIE